MNLALVIGTLSDADNPFKLTLQPSAYNKLVCFSFFFGGLDRLLLQLDVVMVVVVVVLVVVAELLGWFTTRQSVWKSSLHMMH